jgi:hypothetical protein
LVGGLCKGHIGLYGSLSISHRSSSSSQAITTAEGRKPLSAPKGETFSGDGNKQQLKGIFELHKKHGLVI